MTRSETLRRRLVAELQRPDGIASAHVREAFLSVPRELFIPEVVQTQGLDAVYRDRVFVTKQDSRGQAISRDAKSGSSAGLPETRKWASATPDRNNQSSNSGARFKPNRSRT